MSQGAAGCGHEQVSAGTGDGWHRPAHCGEMGKMQRAHPARSPPSHTGDVTSHAEDRTAKQTELELPAQGQGMGDAVQEQWLQRRE